MGFGRADTPLDGVSRGNDPMINTGWGRMTPV